jgi:phosphate/sulfate permease
MAVFEEYLWIAIGGGIMGFAYGFLIGANDVANAFASSVSSKSLTLKQAVLAASIFEFSGAFFLGARVTNTIRSKVVQVKLYDDRPDILMFGMFTALLSAVIMLWGATALGLPVSTTHDIVGCIMGFSIAAKGFDSIEWDVAKTLFLSWIASPLVAGSVSFTFFFLVKTFVLEAADPFHRAYYTFPIVIMIGIGIDLFYILCKCFGSFVHLVLPLFGLMAILTQS